MPSQDDESSAQRVSQILNAARNSALSTAEPHTSAGLEAGEVWPSQWPPGSESTPAPQSGRMAIGFGAGSRWEVPARAAAVVAGVALLIIGALLVGQLRGSPSGPVVPAREPVSLTSGVLSSTAAAVTAPQTAQPGGMLGDPAVLASGTAPASAGALRVYVVGQVRRPGVVSLVDGARVEDAIDAAGGQTARADLTVMNLARKVVDGERIVVPRPGEKIPTENPVPAADGSTAGGAGPGAAPGGPVDLNTATVADLDALPGVGPVIAGRIVAWRQQNGSFKTVDDLGQVSGIGDATLARLRPLVRI